MRKLIIMIMSVAMGLGMVQAQPYFRGRGGNGGYRQTQRETRYRSDYYPMQSSVPYKGFLEMGYSFGVGDNRSDRLDILTTHGLQVGGSAFIGVGAGLSFAFNADGQYVDYRDDYHTTGVSIPLYVDLRFAQPSWKNQYVQPFFDVKVGAQFRISDDDFVLENGVVDGNRSFFFSPTVGIRIPVSYSNAINLGVTYNLTTYRVCDWGHLNDYGDIKGLSSFGVKISYEW